MKIIKRNFEKGRFPDFVFGAFTIIFGLWIQSSKTFYNRGFPVPRAIWILFVIFGTAWSIHAIKNRKNPKKDSDLFKCPGCNSLYIKSKVIDFKCPKCGQAVESALVNSDQQVEERLKKNQSDA